MAFTIIHKLIGTEPLSGIPPAFLRVFLAQGKVIMSAIDTLSAQVAALESANVQQSGVISQAVEAFNLKSAQLMEALQELANATGGTEDPRIAEAAEKVAAVANSLAEQGAQIRTSFNIV